MKQFMSDSLSVQIYGSREEMGRAAAADIKACIRSCLEEKQQISMIFAAAPSQNEVLSALANDPQIPWERIHAFHMDEYIGLPADAPQVFGNFLRRAIFEKVPFASVSYIDSEANDPEAECIRYGKLLEQYPADIVVMGIGENGHIAFNDPPVADFKDPKAVKVVQLDPVCREQQVHDGCFASLEQVPTHAITLTVPTLAKAPCLFCIVPASTKARAVWNTVRGRIGEACPATVLRKRPGAKLYLEPDSAVLL